jgi:nucleotide-binding universal stress UspA family protein
VESERGQIVVGVDASDASERALEWALQEAAVHGDRLLLLHAWQFPAVGVANYAGDTLPVFGRGDLEQLAVDVLDGAMHIATTLAPDVKVEVELAKGHPAAALINASHGARLLVVGSRGHGGFAGMLMGSVSSACARHAHCPVVIVPPSEADEVEAERPS